MRGLSGGGGGGGGNSLIFRLDRSWWLRKRERVWDEKDKEFERREERHFETKEKVIGGI